MNVKEFINNNIVLLDGGTGTVLQAMGLKPGEPTEAWNLSHPDRIQALHREYFNAGSNIVCANTFGANSLKYSHEELEKIIAAAINNALEAKKTSSGAREKFVAMDIGSLGRLLKPLGDLDFEDAVNIFAENIRLGAKYGADLIMIETMNDSYETKAALLAAKENCDLPVFVSNAYGEDGKLMNGASPDAMVAMLEGMGADAIGANCSLGPRQLRGVMEKLLETASVPVLFKPNAGLPKSENGKNYFDVTPEEFVSEVTEMIKKGVRIAGGCCGTTPEYIRLLAESIRTLEPVPLIEKNITAVSSYEHSVMFGNSPVLIGERINPTGKKRLKQALRENDIDYILGEAVTQRDKGAHILDVNVGLPEINEPEMLARAVNEIQAVTSLPLQIDTSDPSAMEKALRIYNGKAMINSVNGKEECMHSVFPLAKKYGGLVVALTLDENGIPATAEGRLAIAEKIISVAAEYGIKKKDIIFDTLAMTVSADKNAANVTLEALRLIGEKLGCKTSLGVSNVSFGLPERDSLNSAFFAMALQNGLSAAIMNPNSVPMMRTYHSFLALRGYDDNCMEYIGFSEEYPLSAAQNVQSNSVKEEKPAVSGLREAVIRGFRDAAAEAAVQLLNTTPPLEIVQNEVIPALNTVGEEFEKKKIYLPQLLMSAEAAKSAFEKIKEAMASGNSERKAMPVVIATVKGDIHDIGKNIVKLLLENYGFAVTDLGKDVEPQAVLDAVISLHAPLAGLSALMTTTVPAMEETIKLIHENAPWCKVIVGGAVLNEEYAAGIGADAYSPDAMGTVRFAEAIGKSLQ